MLRSGAAGLGPLTLAQRLDDEREVDEGDEYEHGAARAVPAHVLKERIAKRQCLPRRQEDHQE